MNAILFGIFLVAAIVGMHFGYDLLRKHKAKRLVSARNAEQSKAVLDIAACQRQLDHLTAKSMRTRLSAAESQSMRDLLRQEASLRDMAEAIPS